MALSGGGSRARRRSRRGQCYRSISQIKEDAKRKGASWFGKHEMRMFGTRTLNKTFPGKNCRCTYFVTSEKRPRSNDARMYTVRKACGGKISTVGEFQGYRTSTRAFTAARSAAKKGK